MCIRDSSGVVFVHNVAERGKIIVPSGTVHAVIDGDKANATPVSYTHLDVYKRQVGKIGFRILVQIAVDLLHGKAL